jgi:hypothetical protein
MKTPHTSTYKGKRVYVRLKTGERFVAKFMGRNGKKVIFDTRTEISGDIKAFSIFRQKATVAKK